ncbi:uncharacterized protein MELLADRAFT_110955 [Melampsora larici-populina 98AG31]|uniref:Uncharacterized protein n=1 Tax=Melampsora larici-populina (strain 98AG31 / pathotype 3-4-7) TaxID=747676 RepID=F4S1J9_MELLP|nr:uncharacterized protein MELLADRAFT_110955 [Melampsora larici-populina 98AG31]EGG01389.1 hypothetical protein MELLADRAFT_110955 [Melampsora larici-populina 98AG31]
MSNTTDQFSTNQISITHQSDRSKYIGTLYAIIAGLSFLLFSIMAFLMCHPPFRKEIRRLFSSKSPHSMPSNHHEIDSGESNITYCGSSTKKLSTELKCIQTDHPTMMAPLTYALPTLGTLSLNTTVKPSSINPESPISPLTIHGHLKTPLPIKTQITQPVLLPTQDHHSIPNLRHPHTISPILKNSQSHSNHSRSSSSNHEMKSIREDYAGLNRRTDSNYLSASLPPIHHRQRFSLFDFNDHSNESVHDHQVRSKSTPLDLNPDHQCYCKPLNRTSASTFIASPISFQEEENFHHRLSQDVSISNEDLYSLNSCQVFPGGSDSHSIDQQPNTIDHLVMSHKSLINESVENDNLSLESNEFYRGRTRSRPTTIINS